MVILYLCKPFFEERNQFKKLVNAYYTTISKKGKRSANIKV